MNITLKTKVVTYNLEVSEEELRQLFRLMRNEIEGADTAETTTYCMYKQLTNSGLLDKAGC